MNTIYISIPYATAIHNCCCGCGNRVVTPISPTDWKLIFDGCSISLEPSIGNWNFPCRSHYFIWNNCVVWAAKWSDAEIKAGRRKDARTTSAYFESKTEEAKGSSPAATETDGKRRKKGLKAKVKKWFGMEESNES